MRTFESEQGAEIRDQYAEEGYVVVSRCVEAAAIDDLLARYAALKRRYPFAIRAQDTNRWEPLTVNAFGLIEHSILNPKDMLLSGGFASALRRCVASRRLSQVLCALAGTQRLAISQTMFFDLSTATVPHQDHYYLDTEPAGRLVAAWLALEDIAPAAGPFFVVPRSHKGPVVGSEPGARRYADHAGYVSRVQAMMAEQGYAPVPCLLRRGDALLWHPFLVHGAFPNQDPARSRKSITAHFIPEGMAWQGEPVPALVATENPAILERRIELSTRLARFVKGNLAVPLRRLGVRRRIRMEMRAREYS